MKEKKSIYDFDYDVSKTIRILPSNTSYGKSLFNKYVYYMPQSKSELRKTKIKNILNAIDL